MVVMQNGETALYKAITRDKSEVAKLLLQAAHASEDSSHDQVMSDHIVSSKTS